MKNISLITVYNNRILLDEMLVSVDKQINVEIDYVMIDNQSGAFSSASAAYNFGVSKAKGDVFVFLHQDIEFLSNTAVEQIYDFASQNRNVLFGVAGVKQRKRLSDNSIILTSFYNGEKKLKNNTVKTATVCFTLDECLFACYRDVMKEVTFDEKVCDGWHLYGADLCLQASLNPNLMVMVVPMNYVWHKSNGNADKSYRRTQNKLAKKYKGKYKIINTTNGYQYTSFLKRMCLNAYRKIKYQF